MEELAVFQRPDVAAGVLAWPSVDLVNVSIYANASLSLTDITDVDNEDDIDNYTVEGDIASCLEPMQLVAALPPDADVVGSRIRIRNVHTTIFKRVHAENAENAEEYDPHFEMDFQVLGEAAWYHCLTPSYEYKAIFKDIIEKTKFWSWLSMQMQYLYSLTDEHEFATLFESLDSSYTSDYETFRFFGLLLKHCRFIISRLLKDRFWDNDLLLRAFLGHSEYRPIVLELSKKLSDAALIIDETKSDYVENNIKLRNVASRKRKRGSDDNSLHSVSSSSSSLSDHQQADVAIRIESSVSPRSRSAAHLFGASLVSPATPSSVLSYITPRILDLVESAAHYLVLFGPRTPGLAVIGSDEYLELAVRELKRTKILTNPDWNKMLGNVSWLGGFCDEVRKHQKLLREKSDEIEDRDMYDMYDRYIEDMCIYFSGRLNALCEIKAAEATAAEADESAKMVAAVTTQDDKAALASDEVIITNEQESERTPEHTAVRHSQKAISKLRPFGSPALAADQGYEDFDADEDMYAELAVTTTPADVDEVQNHDGSVLNLDSELPLFESVDVNFNFESTDPAPSSALTSSSTSLSSLNSINDDISSPISLTVANIQSRLMTSFNLARVSDDVLCHLAPITWTCPQHGCGTTLHNANTRDTHEEIQKHFQTHVQQYLSAMEEMREIGIAGKHVE
ncbi:uncharacterized protein V1518DRAFT_410532 [Limtongia smithiae]|uniref:uncharacterized protein n=1 Tax=Limtongia smithiae TaxID=1125753 RepID=UPI0034CF846B